MSKYKDKGPYHFVEYADRDSIYHSHVSKLVCEINNNVDHETPLRFHEVGCGEGLILHQLSMADEEELIARTYSGNDADSLAVEMAELLLPNWIKVFHEVNIARTKETYDAIMFADSLEHIENWAEHLHWASRARYVIIAVPSIRDKHAINSFGLNTFHGQVWTTGMRCVYSKTREYRHVTIWKKT